MNGVSPERPPLGLSQQADGNNTMATSTSTGSEQKTPSARGAHRAEQIIRAATILFQDNGYQNVSIDQIGAAVGLTGPAVYRHFKGKHDILARALEVQTALVDGLFAASRAEATADKRLQSFIDGLSDLTANSDAATLWRREQQHLKPEQRDTFSEAFTQNQERIAALLMEAHPESTAHHADLIGYTVLAMFSNTPSIRGALSAQRLMHLQRSLAHVMIQTSLPDPGPTSPAAPEHIQRRPAGRRERILEASARLFDERGFYGVPIDDIAKASEMSLATLYQSVTGKTQVLKAILERGAEGLLYVTADALALANTPAEVLDGLVRTYIRQALGVHGRLMHILANDLLYLTTDEQDDLRETQREYVAEWIEAICSLNETVTPADARALAQAVIGVITDVSQTPRLRARPGIADELAALAHAMVHLSGEDQPPGA